MKKFTSAIIAGIMVAAMSVTSFAASVSGGTSGSGGFQIPTYRNEDLNVTGSTPATTTVPITGYIGEDAIVTPIDPSNPNPPGPTPTGTELAVTVPTAILWASFASDSGTVTSPDYKIENRGTAAVKVKLASFTRTDTGAAVSGLNLSLDQVSGSSSLNSVSALVGAANVDLGDIAAASGGTATAKAFKIGGSYTGNFGTAQSLTYDMVLSFSLAN